MPSRIVALLVLVLVAWTVLAPEAHADGRAGAARADGVDGLGVVVEGVGASALAESRTRSLFCTLRAIDPDTGSGPLADQTIAFEARRAGTPTFREVGRATTDDTGVARLRVHPNRTTDYRCSFAGSDGAASYLPARSEVTRLAIGTLVSIHARRTTDGDGVRVTGQARPRKRGLPVVLHARNASMVDPVRLGRTSLDARGRYRFRRALERSPDGYWELWVSVARRPERGLTRGTSGTRYVE